jgi:ATP-dependent protease ClpP protease subunit
MPEQNIINRAELLGRLPPAARTVFNRVVAMPRNDASGAELTLYDAVGYDPWSGGGITAKDFAKQLKALGNPSTITLHVNSPGGDVFDGLSILNQLKQHPARVNVQIDGLAASIASVIAMAGESIAIAPSAMMMIHRAHGGAFGHASDMRQMADLLDKIDGQIAGVYAERSGRRAADFAKLMQADSWFTGEEAIRAKLADSLLPSNRADHRPPQSEIARRLASNAGDRIDHDIAEARRRVAARRPAYR